MSNIIKFQLPCQFQRFLYQTLCVFSQIKENILTEFSFCCWRHSPGVGLGGAGGSKTLARGFAMAPHRLRILVYINLNNILTDFNYATLTSLYIFQKAVECKVRKTARIRHRVTHQPFV